MTSQPYNNNDVLFPPQISKKPHQIKCSDQFRGNKQDTDCFEHLQEENTKLLVNVSVLHASISYRSRVFMAFTEGRGGVMEL